MAGNITIGTATQPATGGDIVMGDAPPVGSGDGDIVIGSAFQPTSGGNIVMGDLVVSGDGALLEFAIPSVTFDTVLVAIVVHEGAIFCDNPSWTRVADSVGAGDFLMDVYTRTVDGTEGTTISFLSLTEQELTGSLIRLSNARALTAVEALDHIAFVADAVPAAAPSSSAQERNTLVCVWAADGGVAFVPPAGFTTIDTYSSNVFTARSLMAAYRTADETGAIDPGSATASPAATGRAFTVVLHFDPSLTDEEQKLYDFAKGALPQWFRDGDEFLMGSAKIFGSVRNLVVYLFGQALIGTATGATDATPDWLHQHARDRGTGRAPGEDDPTLRARLRSTPDALTRSAILDGINAILEANGITADAALLELPRDMAYLGNYTAMTGVGGAFVQSGTTSKFTPSALPWPTPPYQDASVFPVRGHQLVIAGAANASNNGTRTVIGLDGDAAMVANGAGVGNAADAAVTWTVRRMDNSGNVTDGFARAYVGRGYRIYAGPRPLCLLVILPYGTSPGIAASITEMVRTKKAAGFRVIVEYRQVP